MNVSSSKNLYPKREISTQDDRLGDDQLFRMVAIVHAFFVVILNPGLAMSQAQ